MFVVHNSMTPKHLKGVDEVRNIFEISVKSLGKIDIMGKISPTCLFTS